MSYARHDHGNAMSIAIIDAQLVLDGSPRLNHRLNPCLMGNFNTIREGEEGIRGHDSTLQVKAKYLGFFDGLTQCINP